MRWIGWILGGLLILMAAGCNLDTTGQNSGADRPIVIFLYPTDNTTVLNGTDVQIELAARDESGSGIARVELTVDDLPHQQGSPMDAESVPVFTVRMNWLAEGAGLHQMTATAYRVDGTASTPVTIRLSVIEPPEATDAP